MKTRLWKEINWSACAANLATLQEKLAIAGKEQNASEVKRLQNAILSSFEARALAVRRVTSNRGKQTPGVDGVVWNSSVLKFQAIHALKNLHKYKAHPVKRVWIEKPGKPEKRPLGIPTVFDRAVQTLALFALDPLAENSADLRSFGFRRYRSVHDAAAYIRLLCNARYGKRHVLEIDIAKFFDRIWHSWIFQHIPLSHHLLREFLKAPVHDFTSRRVDPSDLGVPQGGVISPLIANWTLDGLETTVSTVPGCFLVRYADDFVVCGNSVEDLTKVKSVIDTFLAERGLHCHPEKSGFTTIEDGFDFLGFHMREFPDNNRTGGRKKGIFLIQPSSSNVRSLKRRVTEICRNKAYTATHLIRTLNPMLRGWADHYRSVSSRSAFRNISKHVFFSLYGWAKRRHPSMPRRELVRKYWKRSGSNHWLFTGMNDENVPTTLFDIGRVTQARHVLILVTERRNPYLSTNELYFERRRVANMKYSALLDKQKRKLLLRQKGLCAHCAKECFVHESLEVHHIIPLKDGGKNTLRNLCVLHRNCHTQLHTELNSRI